MTKEQARTRLDLEIGARVLRGVRTGEVSLGQASREEIRCATLAERVDAGELVPDLPEGVTAPSSSDQAVS